MTYYTIPQVARLIHRRLATVYGWVKAGKLPYYDTGGERGKLISKVDLDEFMKRFRHEQRVERLVDIKSA